MRILAILFFVGVRAHALTPAQVNVQGYNFAGSDGMHLSTLRVGWLAPENESWFKTFGFTGEASRGSLQSYSMQAGKVSGALDFRINHAIDINTTAGVTAIENMRTHVVSTRPAWGVSPHYEHGEFKFGFNFAGDCVYQEWVEPGVVNPFLTEQKLEFNMETPLAYGFKMRTGLNHLFLSDNNQRHAGDTVFLYQFSKGRLDLATGAGMFFIGFNRQTGDYWSAREFDEYTARLEANYQITGNWSAFVALHVGPAVDLHNVDGLDTYYEAHVVYSGFRGVRVELDWDKLQADRPPAFRWTRNDVILNLNGQF